MRSQKGMIRRVFLEQFEDRRMLAAGEVVPPLLNYVDSGFDYLGPASSGKIHIGEDIGAAAGNLVRSIADGTVIFAGDDDYASNLPGFEGYGNVVVIEHTRPNFSKFVSIYGHLADEMIVAAGQQVSAFEGIAYVGTDAENGAGGEHLHLRVNEGALPAGLFDEPRTSERKNSTYTYIGGHFTPNTRHDGLAVLLRPSNAIAHWNFSNEPEYGTHGWEIGNHLARASGSSTHWKLNPNGSDPYILSDQGKENAATSTGYDGLRLSTEFFNAFRISLISNVPGGSDQRRLQLFYRLRYSNGQIDPGFSQTRSVFASDLIQKNEFQLATFDLSSKSFPPFSEIYQLRVDLGSASDPSASDLVEVDWIRGFRLNGLRSTTMSAPVNSTGAGSLKIPVYHSVEQVSASTSPAMDVVFHAAADPRQNAPTVEVDRRSVPPLAAGNRSSLTTEIALTSLPPQALVNGRVYLAMNVVTPGATPSFDQVEWMEVSVDSSALSADLIGLDFDLEPVATTYAWGHSMEASFRVENIGAGYAQGPFQAGVYLSTDPLFDSNDYLLGTEEFSGLQPGSKTGSAINFALPATPPAGFSDGQVYVGLRVDRRNDISNESSESNNQGRGSSIDYLPIQVASNLSNNGEPTIGAFFANSSSIIRGQNVWLAATGVVDNGVVNELVFYLDSNDNGALDDADLYVDHGSKIGSSFSKRVPTSSWPIGAHLLFARARDNFDNFSRVAETLITVLGNGPAVSDAYELNNAASEAAYLGGAGTYQLSNLSITEGDADWFAFDIADGSARIDVTVNFFQEANDSGDLLLEIFRGTVPEGHFDVSQPGNTQERYTDVNASSGRYFVRVAHATIIPGPPLINSNYSLTIAVNPVAGAPHVGNLLASATTVFRGDPIELWFDSIAASIVDNEGPQFFLDVNRDGFISGSTDQFLGVDYGPNPDLANGKFGISRSTGEWPLGSNIVHAYVASSTGESLTRSIVINVVDNRSPEIGSLSSSAQVTAGSSLTIVAEDVEDSDGTISAVRFYRDSDDNGLIGAADQDLGLGIRIGTTWTLVTPTTNWPSGLNTILAAASDDRGAISNLPSVSVQVLPQANQRPAISSLTGPSSATLNSSFSLQADDVTDADGTISQVAFFLDSNLDDQLDVTDSNLGVGSPNGQDWTKVIDTTDWMPGQHRLFAKATDNGSPALTDVQSFSVVVMAPPTLQVASVTPTATGVVAEFSGEFDAGPLNLYDIQAGALGSSDVTLVGLATGNVRGSLVIGASLRKLTFLATSGLLPPDSYTLTLRSAANGFHDSTGALLDGDADGIAGGNLVYDFDVTAPAAATVTVGLPNVARGPGQAVNLPANGTSGVPLSLSNGAGITSATLEVRYDPALLNITAAAIAPGLPVGATVDLNTSSPGIAVIQFTTPTPLPAGITRFVDLQAAVPASAVYRTKQVLDITNISLNGGAIPAMDDDGLHVAAFFADVTGDGTYSAQDASLIARLAVGLDSGFQDFRLLDPKINGDITGDGSISAQDVSYMLQLAVSIPVPEVPTPLPAVSLTRGGPDPKLSIPQNLAAAPGEPLVIPVDIDSIVDLTGNGLASADLVIYYDPTVLEITSASLGRLVANRGWMISSRINQLAGRIDISLAGTNKLEGVFRGELVELHATVKVGAKPGASAINLAATSRMRTTQLNEGFLTLIPAPTDAANDSVDGRVTIRVNETTASPSAENTARLIGEQLLITGSAGNDRILVAPTNDGRLRVRVGGQLLGDFAARAVAIDSLTGNDFIYVAPIAPAALVVGDLSERDQIFGGENVRVVSSERPDSQQQSLAANSGGLEDAALLQLLANWTSEFSDQPAIGRSTNISLIRRR